MLVGTDRLPGEEVLGLGPLVEPNPAAGNQWQEIVRLRDETRAIIARNVAEPML